jgi:hypothetical protein
MKADLEIAGGTSMPHCGSRKVLFLGQQYFAKPSRPTVTHGLGFATGNKISNNTFLQRDVTIVHIVKSAGRVRAFNRHTVSDAQYEGRVSRFRGTTNPQIEIASILNFQHNATGKPVSPATPHSPQDSESPKRRQRRCGNTEQREGKVVNSRCSAFIRITQDHPRK